MKSISPKIRLAIVGSLVVVGAGVFFSLQNSTINPIPERIRTNVKFSLYYPSKLPSQYTIDPASFTDTNGVVSYLVKSKDDKSILFTQQKTPDSFDFDNFYNDQLRDKRRTMTKYGEVVLGTFEGNTVASLRTPETWVMVSASKDISPGTLETVIASGLTESH